MAHVERAMPHPILLWPFVALWRLAGFLVRFTGYLMAIILGLGLMGLGVLFCCSVVGAIAGIPLFVLGALLVIKGLF